MVRAKQVWNCSGKDCERISGEGEKCWKEEATYNDAES